MLLLSPSQKSVKWRPFQLFSAAVSVRHLTIITLHFIFHQISKWKCILFAFLFVSSVRSAVHEDGGQASDSTPFVGGLLHITTLLSLCHPRSLFVCQRETGLWFPLKLFMKDGRGKNKLQLNNWVMDEMQMCCWSFANVDWSTISRPVRVSERLTWTWTPLIMQRNKKHFLQLPPLLRAPHPPSVV